MADTKLTALPFGTKADLIYGEEGGASKKYSGMGWFNVKDSFGALGNGIHDDRGAIQSAVNAVVAANGGTIFFPPGAYFVTGTIDCTISFANSTTTTPGVGRMVGSGPGITKIFGTLNYVSGTTDQGCILDKSDMIPSVIGELCDISIENNSTVIGTVAVRWSGQSTIARNVSLHGMCCLDANSNNFATVAYNLITSSPGNRALGSVGVNGNFGVFGFRTNGGHETCFLMADGPHHLDMLGMEECTIGLHLGVRMTSAMECSLSGTTLTIGGPTGSLHPEKYQGYAALGATFINPGSRCFVVANNIAYGVSVNVDSQLTSTEPGETHGGSLPFDLPGARGTYHCVITGGSASFTTQPITIRNGGYKVYASSYTNIQTEGDLRAIVVEASASCHIANALLTASTLGAATTAGSGVATGSNTSTSQCGVYIDSCGDTTFQNIEVATNSAQGDFVFGPNFSGNPTFIDCSGDPITNSVSDTLAFIDDGSGAGTYVGGSGTHDGNVLTVFVVTGSSVGRGTYLTGSGLPTGSNRYVVKDGVLGWPPGFGSGKQYTLMKPNGSAVSTRYAPGNAITFNFGGAWGVSDTNLLYPIPNSIGIGQVTRDDLFSLKGKSGLQFLNCNNPAIGFNFSELPAQTGTPSPPVIGDEFYLLDSPAAAAGNFYVSPAPGSGSNPVRVRCVEVTYFLGKIDNGAGGVGDILTVTSFAPGGGTHISPGMSLTDYNLGGGNDLNHVNVVLGYGVGGTTGTGGAGSTTYKLSGVDFPFMIPSPHLFLAVLWVIV